MWTGLVFESIFPSASEDADGRRDWKEGQGSCQRIDLPQSPSSGCAKDPDREARVGGGFRENRMCRLVE